MKWSALVCVGGWLALSAGAAAADEPEVGPPPQPYPGLPAPAGPALPGTTVPLMPECGPGRTSAECRTFPAMRPPAPNAQTNTAPAQEPALFGDLIGIRAERVILIPTVRGRLVVPAGTRLLDGNIATVLAPLPLHSAYNIGEDESPRPQDRVYFSYNYYDDVNRLLPAAGLSDLDRETIGVEKTFADGNASIGLRLPFVQLIGNESVEDDEVGDLSVILKYAVVNDRENGNLLSTGVVVTAPTGQALAIAGQSDLRDIVVQPFFGYIHHFNNFYIEGFSSTAVPTDFRDAAVMFNSIGVGYQLFQDVSRTGLIQGIVPQAELHVNTPLTHRGLTSTPVNFSDSVDLTFGCHVQFRRTDLGVAVSTPVTGPEPYDVEAEVNVSFHW